MKEIFPMSELLKIPFDKWPAVYQSLNSWKWPEQLSHVKPSWFENENSSERHMDFISPVMKKISDLVGERRLLWENNKERMAPEEFQEWYDHRSDSRWMDEYYKKRLAHVEAK